jgi:uncharacterized damage-inducible protein DinB
MSEENLPELATLGRYLDLYRDVVHWKVEGVDLEAAKRPMVPSGTNLLGVVKHLAYVERWWFQSVIAGDDVDFPDWATDEPDADFRITDDESIESVLAFYDVECERSREILAGLDDPDALRSAYGEDISVRRILVHMVEEVARHAGHMDILRELIDGAVGDDSVHP